MKRGFITLFLLALLVSPMILAEENNQTKEKINILQTNVSIPSFKFLYLIPIPGFTLQLNWVQLIVYLVAATFIFIAALEILSFTAFESGWVKALIAGALVVIIGIFGLLQMLVDLFYNALDNFQLIAWGIAILVIAFLLIKPIISMIRERKRLSKAEELGTAAGAALKGLKQTAEAAAEASKEK